MAEWLYEAGIGEARAALVADGRIVEARIEREGEGPRIGAILEARLAEPGKLVLDAPGEPAATIANLPAAISLGSKLTVEITRMALRERGRDKPARARLAEPGAALADGPGLRARLAAGDIPVTEVGAQGPDRLEAAGWSELIDHVRAGHWPFPGGALWVDTTPAMTLIDIDGEGDAFALAKAGAVAAAQVIRCCGIGGSIGIDFPSLRSRTERLAVDALVDESLPQPFERTGTNGFGLMQIIRRRERPSLVEQIRFDPVATDAALLLRHAERAVGTGALTLTTRPVVAERLAAHPGWTHMLQARTGRPVAVAADCAIKGPGHAQ
ncbi:MULTISPECIES: ribonuclease [unclassified Sphingopyxis]|uniref:ribonuclease n=1 Tax=unclassified Sphingopyxis TaxID=2614943 RepID=UPI0007364E79|nr:MULTISPECIES: ribonuclease [unclassified Sphingopyxis]KTE32793.1 ribonuclease [Sphingopyxis sp. HIX]KTE84966.1 ribonuclease [Sphingopyxis sp. HXXIV]